VPKWGDSIEALNAALNASRPTMCSFHILYSINMGPRVHDMHSRMS